MMKKTNATPYVASVPIIGGMKTDDTTPYTGKRACQCPACSASPSRTYTPEYMQECLARWFVGATPAERASYLDALMRQTAWQTRLAGLKEIAQRIGLPIDEFPI